MNVVAPCLGVLGVPKKPHFVGQEKFKGKIVHTAEWDTICDVKNKRVAVIGTGASAIQMSPTIAPQVEAVLLY